MKKRMFLVLAAVLCCGLLSGCGREASETAAASATTAASESTEEAFVLRSNSEKATLRAEKDYKSVIQITSTYPEELLCVFADPAIAACEWAQWVGEKGSLMITGLKQGETTLTIYAGAVGGDPATARESLTVKVTVE